MNTKRRRPTNSIELDILARWILGAFLAGIAGLFFVYVKNRQHAVGNEARLVEAALAEVSKENEALKAKITVMTSRGALQRRLDEKSLKLEQIRDTAIARIAIPASVEPDGVLRTASADPENRIGAGTPQRAISR
jgi:hypothetical protein